VDRNTYLKQLEQAHDIEVFGESFYGTVARWTRDPGWRETWLTLARLETQTKERIANRLRPEATILEKARRQWWGRTLGVMAALAPRRLVLRIMVSETAGYTRYFEKLREAAPPEDAGLADYMVAHEQAQAKFAKAALDGMGDTAIQPVEALLGSQP
jgi:hypothetical protein